VVIATGKSSWVRSRMKLVSDREHHHSACPLGVQAEQLMTEIKLRQSGHSEQQQASAGQSTGRAEPAQNGTGHQQSGRAGGAGPQGMNGAGLKHRHPHGREEPVQDPVSGYVERMQVGFTGKAGAADSMCAFNSTNDGIANVVIDRGLLRSASWWHRFSKQRWGNNWLWQANQV
jgi:hypothetical protein